MGGDDEFNEGAGLSSKCVHVMRATHDQSAGRFRTFPDKSHVYAAN